MNCSPRYTKTQNISGAAQAMPGGSGPGRQGCPGNGRRQCSLNPYALLTVIVRTPASGFPDVFVPDCVHPQALHDADMVLRPAFARGRAACSGEGGTGSGACRLGGDRRLFAVRHSQCCASDVRMRRDGPPRMEGRSTWSGRERSSHSRFPPVPRVGLVTFRFSSALFPLFLFPFRISRIGHCGQCNFAPSGSSERTGVADTISG
jgi:hypothetical protein